MKRDFLLGGTKLPTGGAVRGAGGGHVPPSLYVKRGPDTVYSIQYTVYSVVFHKTKSITIRY